ncbi:MAG: porin [Pseudomonadota bacterium]
MAIALAGTAGAQSVLPLRPLTDPSTSHSAATADGRPGEIGAIQYRRDDRAVTATPGFGEAGDRGVSRLTYFTPSLGGLHLGAGVGAVDPAFDNAGDGQGSSADVSALYAQRFGSVDLAVSGRVGLALGAGTDSSVGDLYAFGASVGFHGFTIGGSFADSTLGKDIGFTAGDSMGWDVGIAYNTGPWGFSLSYLAGERVDDGVAGGTGIAMGDGDTNKVVAGLRYRLGQGVDVGAFGAFVDPISPGEAEAGTSIGSDVEGFVIGTGIQVDF